MKKQLLTASLAFSALASFGAGYQINLEGLRQMAMGGAGSAWVWDASTIFYNPGGVARLKTLQAYGSIMNINPSTAYGNTTGSTRSVAQSFTTFNFYFGGTVKKDSRLGLGLGIYTPFGNGLKWEDGWTGRFLTQEVQLRTIFVQPTVSYKLGEFLSVGAGFIYANGTFMLRNAIPVQQYGAGYTYGPNADGGVDMRGQGNGVGFNLGLHFKPSDNLQVGLTYRSQVNMNVGGGNATFYVPTSLKTEFPNGQFETSLPLPQVASLGIGFRPLGSDKLTICANVDYTGWNSFDSLVINFKQHTDQLKDQHVPRHYKNTTTYRLGGTYKISKVVSAMAGASYDQSPTVQGFVSPDLPDYDRVNISFGASVRPAKRITLLAACEFTATPKHAVTYDFGNFNGTYTTQAITVGIGAHYNF